MSGSPQIEALATFRAFAVDVDAYILARRVKFTRIISITIGITSCWGGIAMSRAAICVRAIEILCLNAHFSRIKSCYLMI